jgi:hypothetical protein
VIFVVKNAVSGKKYFPKRREKPQNGAICRNFGRNMPQTFAQSALFLYANRANFEP